MRWIKQHGGYVIIFLVLGLAVLRVLTLSTLYPDRNRTVQGTFVERQTQGLAAHPDVECQVVVPRGLPPWPLTRSANYRDIAALPAQEVWNGVTVHRPRFLHIPKYGARFDAGFIVRALVPLLTRLRTHFAFDIIDAEYFFPDGPAAVALGLHFNVPVSVKARGSDIHLWGTRADTAQQVRAAGQASNGMLAVSAALKRDMVALGMPEERIMVHYTGIDLSLFEIKARDAVKQSLGISGKLIVSVGTLNERKGHELVIAALAHIPEATLVIAGMGPSLHTLTSLAQQLGVAERVRFVGSQSRSQVAQWLAAADVMALPSASEGLANVWVEALASGTPVVTCDVGGAREVIKNDIAGRLVARNGDAVAAGIRELLAAPPDQAEVRACVAPLSWEANTAALYAHLKRLVSA